MKDIKEVLPPVYIMNMCYTGLGVARNLKGNKISVVGLSSSYSECGNFSRHCKSKLFPNSGDAQEELLDYLLQQGKKLNTRAVIFPTRDHDVLFLSRHRDILEDYFIIPLPWEKSIDTIIDKWKLYQAAKECGVPGPRTYRIESVDDLERIKGELEFPCVVKPAKSYTWRSKGAWEAVGARKAFKVRSLEELLAEYEIVRRVDKEIVVQEFIKGDDDQIYIMGSYFNRSSEPIATFTARKLKQHPKEFGTGCLVESVKVPEVEELGIRLLKHLKYFGISEVEFKKDLESEKYKLIEVNPRHWDWHRLGAVCGVNLSYIAYQDLTGQLLELPKNGQRSGVKWIAEKEYLLSIVKDIRKGRASLNSALRLAKGKKEYGTFSWEDPFPFLAFLIEITSFLFTSVGRHFFKRFRVVQSGTRNEEG